jgi:spore germination protein
MMRFFYILLLISFLLTGCVKQEVLEKITISFVCAFDEAPNDEIEFTLAVPKFQPGKSGFVSNILFSKVGHTTRNLTDLMEMQLNRPIKPGKLSVILVGKELAEKGLADKLDVILRDAQASRKIYIAIVDGRAKDILETDFSLNEEKGMFLYHLLDTNIRTGHLPRQNLHDFEYSYLGKGLDPFLPFLTLQQNNRVQITGLALFKDDKYIMSLNEKQMRVMKLLLGNVRYGTLETKLDNGPYIAVKNIGSKVDYQLGKEPKGPKVLINLSLKAEVIDSKGIQLSNDEKQRIKERLEEDLTETGMDLLQVFKKEGIDPLGLGDFDRSKTRHWSEAAWKEEYSTMSVKLDVKVNLTEMGIRK